MEDFASPEYARRLAIGPTNGVITANELLNMFDDFYDIVASMSDCSFALPPEVYSELAGFERLVRDAMGPTSTMPDSKFLETAAWSELQLSAQRLLSRRDFEVGE